MYPRKARNTWAPATDRLPYFKAIRNAETLKAMKAEYGKSCGAYLYSDGTVRLSVFSEDRKVSLDSLKKHIAALLKETDLADCGVKYRSAKADWSFNTFERIVIIDVPAMNHPLITM